MDSGWAKRSMCDFQGGGFLISHNLDERTAEAQPGTIFINKRGERICGGVRKAAIP